VSEESTRTKPIPDPDSEPFWAALRERRLLLQRCRACGATQLYFRAMCKVCWSRELEHVESGGKGRVYSSTIVHQVGDPALRPEVPFVLALVDLDEGPRLLTRVTGDFERVAIGDPVRASYVDIEGDCTLVYFERIADA
jgi:uncharacterized OB-fold protein